MNSLFHKAVLILAAMPVALGASASLTYFETDFNTGSKSLPTGMSTDYTGSKILTSCYSARVTVKNTWNVNTCGTKGAAATVGTHTLVDTPSERNMTTPAFTVDNNNAIIRWQGRSMLPGFPEQYSVYAIDQANNEKTLLFSTEAEADWWTWHCVSLAPVVNKNVVIQFSCTTPSGFMLCIDDLFAGVPDDAVLDLDLTSPYFQSYYEDGFLSGNVACYGGKSWHGVKVYVNNEEVDSQEFSKPLTIGETADFQLNLPATLDQRTYYKLTAYADNIEVTLTESDVFFGAYRRTQFVEKATGYWCNNCPAEIVTAQALERKYGHEICLVEPHGKPSVFAVDEYWKGTGFVAAPYFMVNRNKQFRFSSFSEQYVQPPLYHPVEARIDGSDSFLDTEKRQILINAQVEFDKAVDNSADRYRIGYVFTHDIYNADPNTGYPQSNSCTAVTHEQYAFMPSNIPCWLNKMQDVPVTGAVAHQGIPNSLPQSFQGREAQSVPLVFDLPETFAVDEPNGRLAAYIIDTQTDIILNTTFCHFDNMVSTSISMPESDNIINANATPVYYDLQGRMVNNPQNGLYIKVANGKSSKVIIK